MLRVLPASNVLIELKMNTILMSNTHHICHITILASSKARNTVTVLKWQMHHL